MAKKTFDDLAADVLRDLKDTSKSFWTIQEIKEYLDEGQLEYCEETLALRSQFPITTKENIEIYTFPDDMIKPLRLENQDGDKIDLVDSQYLQKEFGNNYRDKTATYPTHAYSDLDGELGFRLYPRPTSAIDVSLNEPLDYFQSIDVNSDISTNTSISSNYGLFYVYSDEFITSYDKDYNVIRRVVHGLTLGSDKIYSASGDLADGKIYFAHDDNIYIFDGKSVPTIFATPSASSKLTAFYVFYDRLNGDKIIYGRGTDLYCSDLPTFSEETIRTSVTIKDFERFEANNGASYALFALGSAGLYYAEGSDLTVDTQAFTDNCQGCTAISFSGNWYVFADVNGTLSYQLAGSFTLLPALVSTTVTGIKDYGMLSESSNNKIYYIDTAAMIDTLEITAVSSDDLTLTYTISTIPKLIPNTNVFQLFKRSATMFNKLFHGIYKVGVTLDIISNIGDYGGITSIDDNTFLDDDGVIVDYIDNSQTVIIDGDIGIPRIFIDADDQGTIFYIRRPIDKVLEIRDEKVLTDYAKYRCLEKKGDRQNLAESERYRQFFMKRIDREKGKSGRGYINSSQGVKSHHF